MEAWLNTAALSDPNSFLLSVTIIDHAVPSFPTLLDSGSTHCFVDLLFANTNNLSHYTIPLIILHLFDATTTTIITKATDLPIQFPSGGVTPLDSNCRIILRHNWLTWYNPLIGWVMRVSSSESPCSECQPQAHSPTLTNNPQAPWDSTCHQSCLLPWLTHLRLPVSRHLWSHSSMLQPLLGFVSLKVPLYPAMTW